MHRLTGLVLNLIVCVCAPALANVDTPLRSQEEMRLSDLIPLATWHRQFEITEGKDRGKVVPLTLDRDSIAEGRWNLRFGDYARIRLHNDGSRGLVMERLDLIKSRSYIIYEPALPILAPDMTRDGAVRRQANFKMLDLGTGKLKRMGRVTHVVREVSPGRFDTPAGLINGFFIEIDHRMDMQYAQLQLTLGLGCRLDDGPVFGSGQYTLTKLGIFQERKSAAAALTQANAAVAPRP
jgi:hypothetical protein